MAATAELALLSLALGLDSFRISLGLGATELARGVEHRLAFSFGLCDAVSLAVGVALGRSLGSLVGSWVDGLGPPVLGAYALYVLWLARRHQAETVADRWVLLGLPLMLSCDNLVVGGTLGGLRISLLATTLFVGVASGLLALAGLALGRRAVRSLQLRPELAGGALLLAASALSLFAGD
jgi:manganese efflux pump family protein